MDTRTYPELIDRHAYRPEIDGLRTIAVFSVVFFHADFAWAQGGFVGVDVFFVISGYLITGILLREQREVGAALLSFYERRIRRILPPLVPVFVAACAVAWLLSAEERAAFAKSLAASALFSANWYFLEEANYFDGAAAFKPLLHMWSLSIEEQFYLIAPLVVLLVRSAPRLALLFLAAIAASLSYDQWLLSSGEQEIAFYNSLGRFWELLLGALIAAVPWFHRIGAKTARVLRCCGFLLIGGAVLWLTPERFPGVIALIPTLGAAAIIIAGSVGRDVGFWVLTSPAIVYLGKISYGLYLWHWPVFVALRLFVVDIEPFHFAAAIAVSIGLASISYHFIEIPVRNRDVLVTSARAYAAQASAIVMFAGLGIVVVRAEGWPQADAARIAAYRQASFLQRTEWTEVSERKKCWLDFRLDISEHRACLVPDAKRTNVLLIGDSHAAHLVAGFKSTFEQASTRLFAVDSCTLTPELVRVPRRACQDLIAWLDADFPFHAFDHIVVSVRHERVEDVVPFAQRIKALQAKAHRPMTVIGPVPFYQPNQPTLFARNVERTPGQLDRLFDAAVQREMFEIDEKFRAALSGIEVKYVSALAILCPEGAKSCRHLDANGWPIMVDNSHLTADAARELVAAWHKAGLLLF